MISDINFPEDFPCALLEDNENSVRSPTRQTTFASGRDRVRRVFEAVPVDMDISWAFTYEQFERFQEWFIHDIHDGASWFNMRVLTASGIKTMVCRFSTDNEHIYNYSKVGIDRIKVTANVEQWERYIEEKRPQIKLLAENGDDITTESGSDILMKEDD